jgi:hypothetical protein
MATAFNKVTHEWDSFEDTSGLSADWVIDPVFEDQALAMKLGPNYWQFTGNVISTITQAEFEVIELAQTKLTIWLLIQAERDRRKSGGVLVGAHWFHSDDTSRIQFIGLLMYGANMPNNIMWKTMAGAFVQMTPTLAQQIFGSIAAKDTSIFTVAETHKAQMYASATPSTYNYLTGTPAWPLIYGE